MNINWVYTKAAYLEKSGNFRTPGVMLVYHNLMKPRVNKGKDGVAKGAPKYDITVCVPREVSIALLEDAVNEKLTEAFKKDAKFADVPFRSLDDPKDKTAATITEALEKVGLDGEFTTFFSVRSEDKPQVVGPKREEITEEDASLWLYSGAPCAVTFSPYTYDKEGNKGCAFGLRNVQMLGKGVKLELGRRQANVDDEFEEIDAKALNRGRDDDEKPARRSRDEDDEPRRRPRDEDDEKPARRSRDEDDEKPARRSRDDDEPRRRPRDEDDEKPARRSRDEDEPVRKPRRYDD